MDVLDATLKCLVLGHVSFSNLVFFKGSGFSATYSARGCGLPLPSWGMHDGRRDSEMSFLPSRRVTSPRKPSWLTSPAQTAPPNYGLCPSLMWSYPVALPPVAHGFVYSAQSVCVPGLWVR